MKTALALFLVAPAAAVVRVQLAPVDPARRHVDPLTAGAPVGNGWPVRDGADAAPPRFGEAAGKVLASRPERSGRAADAPDRRQRH